MIFSVWTAIVFWAFILGFLLGLSFPDPGEKKARIISETKDGGFDFFISDKEYENFLSYDGTTQQKEQDYGKRN